MKELAAQLAESILAQKSLSVLWCDRSVRFNIPLSGMMSQSQIMMSRCVDLQGVQPWRREFLTTRGTWSRAPARATTPETLTSTNSFLNHIDAHAIDCSCN